MKKGGPPGAGRGSKEKQPRRHTHTDYAAKGRSLDENGLLSLVGRLERPAFLLILDNVQDPHNLGACLRSADAAGADAVVVPKDRSVGLTETVRHVACGAAEHIPFAVVTNLARTLRQLKEAGVWLVGTTHDTEKLIYDVDLAGPIGIVMGSEGKGLRRLTAEHCDFLARIPMLGSVDCLNVSVATGICLFEVVRQRGARP